MSVRRARLGTKGRISIPAPFCRALGIHPGDELIIQLTDGAVQVTSPRVAIQRARRMVDRYVSSDVSLVDSLITDRRAEAAGD